MHSPTGSVFTATSSECVCGDERMLTRRYWTLDCVTPDCWVAERSFECGCGVHLTETKLITTSFGDPLHHGGPTSSPISSRIPQVRYQNSALLLKHSCAVMCPSARSIFELLSLAKVLRSNSLCLRSSLQLSVTLPFVNSAHQWSSSSFSRPIVVRWWPGRRSTALHSALVLLHLLIVNEL